VDKLIQILVEIKNEPDLLGCITASTDVLNELGLDSLEMINLALRVEDEFQITIDFETFDFETLLSVKSFWDFIEGCRDHIDRLE
jgi:acyl carrier protein